MKRTEWNGRYIRPYRISTVRKLQENGSSGRIDDILTIVHDCLIDSEGKRIFETVEAVEDAVENESLTIAELNEIVVEATALTNIQTKK